MIEKKSLHRPALTRRGALMLGAGALGAAATFGLRDAAAQVRLQITEGNFQPMPIAIPDFFGSAARFRDRAQRLRHRDQQSAPLRACSRRSIRLPSSRSSRAPTSTPNYADWRAIKAQALVAGQIIRQGDGRLHARFRLYDVFGGEQQAGQQYTTTPENWRRIAHIISDAIYERLTGDKGYFDTRVVFVDENGPKDRRVKRLAIMDQDGANIRYLTRGDDLVLTPRFSPSTQEITYMSFGQGDPRVYLLNIETNQREIVGNFPGMTFAPRFSPDGQRVIMSLQQGSNSNLFVMDLRSRATTRLTQSPAIDTSPSYAPDGSRICFESDRGGSQQIYVMASTGGQAQRISFGEGSYSTPVWSPRGDTIAFTKQGGGRFSIGIMRVDGSGERILTEGFHNEGPTFAPNGRVLMFFREGGGQSGPSLFSVDITGRNEQKVPTPSFASDPAWSPLLS